jgi:hypothetical protein
VGVFPSDLAVASLLGQEGVFPSDLAAASRLGQEGDYRSLQAAGSAPIGIGAVASIRGKYPAVTVFSQSRSKAGASSSTGLIDFIPVVILVGTPRGVLDVNETAFIK